MKTLLLVACCLLFGLSARAQIEAGTLIRCGNLVYGKGQTSVCFGDYFLEKAAQDTGLPIAPKFVRIKLAEDEVFQTPFTVFNGEGSFKLSDKERSNFRAYLERGGFIVASPGCSSREWSVSFRAELATMFPDKPMKKIPMSHPVFSTVSKIPVLTLGKKSGTTMLEGLEIDGRLALVFSPEGLNDAHHAKGCCCCGGNEVREAIPMNINLLVYALVY